MDLPLKDEIRAARALAEEATDATLHLNRAHSTLSSIVLLERQLAGKPAAEIPVPGNDLIELLSDRWPQLADLASSGPRPTQSTMERLRLRREQVQEAMQFLEPLGAKAAERNAEMADLQHKQRHLLDAPDYAPIVRELQVIGQERESVGARLHPLNNQFQAMAPTQRVIVTFIGRLDAAAKPLPRPGLSEWRAATVASSLIGALVNVLAEMNLEIPPPDGIDVPVTPDPADAERLSTEVARVRAALVDLERAIDGRASKLKVELDALQQRHDELTEMVKDRMG